jgi:hypothetical protein
VLIVLAMASARAIAAPSPDDDGDLGIDRAAPADVSDVPALWGDEPSRPPAWQRLPPCDCDDDALAHAIATAPPLPAVVAAAERAAGVAGDPTRGWRRRSRLSALIPWITVRAGNSESWRDVVDPTINHAAAVSASLGWRLDRLLFDPNEPRLASYDIARRRERRRIAYAASAAYFAYVEAVASTQSVRDSPHARLALMEAVARLDALTAAWFSHTLAKPAGSR